MSAKLTRCVWSFWSKPFRAFHNSVWASEKHHLLAWVLSFETARRHYPETVLHTDDAGARLLIDGLGLPFVEVSTALNELKAADPQWWVLGKLHAYRAQTRPFLHIDTDVFLWNALPPAVTAASLFGQNPEWFPFDGESWYRPRHFDAWLRLHDGWKPEEWTWNVDRHGGEAICCGVLGGQRADFLSYYADQALQFVHHPRNASIWSEMGSLVGDNILFEQYFLSACIAFHRNSATSPFRDLDVHYLFESPDEAYYSDRPRELGYTHLIGGAKRNTVYVDRLEQRVARDYPEHYRRCLRYLELAA
jgi:hypothetical protein